MTLDSLNAFTVTVALQSVLWMFRQCVLYLLYGELVNNGLYPFQKDHLGKPGRKDTSD